MMEIKSIDDLVAKDDEGVYDKSLDVLYIIDRYLMETVITHSVFDAQKGTWVTLKELKAKPKEDLLLAQFGMDVDSVYDDLIMPILTVDNAKEFNRLLTALKNTVVPGYIDIIKRARSMN